jgi:hypothetical protein
MIKSMPRVDTSTTLRLSALVLTALALSLLALTPASAQRRDRDQAGELD